MTPGFPWGGDRRDLRFVIYPGCGARSKSEEDRSCGQGGRSAGSGRPIGVDGGTRRRVSPA